MFHTSGFVLRRSDYREYDRIYTIYSEEYGKISLLARGARKIKSKLAPHLENFSEVRVNFAKGKVFNHLSGANAVSFNKGLINDAEKIVFISDCFYLLDRFIKPEEGDARIYELMKEVFGAITGNFFSPHRDALQKIRIYFFWRLIDLLGYRPQLDECALCGRHPSAIPAPSSVIPVACPAKPEGRSGKAGIQFVTKFNITDNIIICGECVGDGLHIQENTLINLKKIFESSLTEFLKIDLDSQLIVITEKARQIKLSEL